MALQAEEQLKHVGKTRGIRDHDHDMVHELSKRLDSVWRIDQYIANAAGKPEVQEFWKGLKEQETKNIESLKHLVSEEVRSGCF